MIKREEKGLTLALILIASVLLVVCGFMGWRAYLIPVQYIGYVLGAIGLAGLAGVNIWVGPFAIDPDDKQPDDKRGPTL